MLSTETNDINWESNLRQELRKLKLGREDVVIALPGWVNVALSELGIPTPDAPDYPDCLQSLLCRKIWKSTL